MTATRRHTIAHTQQHSWVLDPPVPFTVTSPALLARGQHPAALELDHVGVFWRVGGHHGDQLTVDVVGQSTRGAYVSVGSTHEPVLLDLFADLIEQTRPVVVTAHVPDGGPQTHPIIAAGPETPRSLPSFGPDPVKVAQDSLKRGPLHTCQHGNQFHDCTCDVGVDHSVRSYAMASSHA